MKKILALFMLVSSTAFASADCLNSYYDLGADAAAIGLFCDDDNSDSAQLVFCKRQPLLDSKYCNGMKDPISCTWQKNHWLCENGGEYPYMAKINRLSFDKILFQFKSKFNSGTRTGVEIR